jgi:hypothetical protein
VLRSFVVRTCVAVACSDKTPHWDASVPVLTVSGDYEFSLWLFPLGVCAAIWYGVRIRFQIQGYTMCWCARRSFVGFLS